MVEILESSMDECVVMKCSGKVTGEEYKVFLDEVDRRLEASDTVSVAADLADFEFDDAIAWACKRGQV